MLLTLLACAGDPAPDDSAGGASLPASIATGESRWSASPAPLPLGASFGDAAVELRSSAGALRVRTRAAGRAGAMVELPRGTPRPAPCPAGRPAGCAAVAYAQGGLSSWWIASARGYEQGWTLAQRPPGEGPLSLRIELDGAAAVVQRTSAHLLLDSGERWSVTGLHAVDADGVVLDAWFAPSPGGLSVQVDDRSARYPIVIDPLYSNGLPAIAGEAASGFGFTVALADDLNGDGFDDVLAGAPNYSSGAGRVYVFYGSSSGVTASSATGADLILEGSSGAAFGWSVAGAGDVNGDGYGDAVIGAPNYDSARGAAYVFLGSASGLSTTAATSLSGSSVGVQFGFSVAGAVDLNADGLADIAVGSPIYNNYYGLVSTYHGSSGGISTSASANVTGLVNSSLGTSLSGAGDVNGDGYDDLISGGPTYRLTTGYILALYGAASGVSSSYTASLISNYTGSNFGFSVDGAGDVDGDGYDDVVIGGSSYGLYNGLCVVYYGSSTGVVTLNASVISGANAEELGSAVRGMGDVNGDGFSDIGVGARAFSGALGKVELYEGSASGLVTTVAWTVLGTATAGSFGYALDGGGDINADGSPDGIVGAYAANSQAGEAQVLFGGVDADQDGVIASFDCDDSDPSRYPGAAELCDSADLDEDCDGLADDADPSITNSSDYYADLDGDSFGGSLLGTSCDPPTGAILLSGDCNDSDPFVSPSATELCDSADADEDCDGLADEADPSLSGTPDLYEDADLDGFGGSNRVVACEPGPGLSELSGDCDDADDGVHPEAEERCDVDNVDEDCDGLSDDADSPVLGQRTLYLDADQDGYGELQGTALCDASGQYLAISGDCDDSAPGVHPEAAELCNGIDDDCDGGVDLGALDALTWYADADGDGYTDPAVATDACAAPSGYAAASALPDCDDADAGAYPGAGELAGDGVDQDCDGSDTPEPVDSPADTGTPKEPSCGCGAGAGGRASGFLLLLAMLWRRARS